MELHYFYVTHIGYYTIFTGILVTNTYLKNLLIEIKNMNGRTYIMTRKLNQDILENLFSFLKGMTGCASNISLHWILNTGRDLI